MPPKPAAGLLTEVVNDKGRSHQQLQIRLLRGMEFRAGTVLSLANAGILEAHLWLGDRDRVLLATASFIYYSLLVLANPQETSRSLVRDGDSSLK